MSLISCIGMTLLSEYGSYFFRSFALFFLLPLLLQSKATLTIIIRWLSLVFLCNRKQAYVCIPPVKLDSQHIRCRANCHCCLRQEEMSRASHCLQSLTN